MWKCCTNVYEVPNLFMSMTVLEPPYHAIHDDEGDEGNEGDNENEDHDERRFLHVPRLLCFPPEIL